MRKNRKTIAVQFLKKVMKKMEYEIFDFFKQTKELDLPTMYRERQLHSVLFPAIYYSSDVVMLEPPTDRKSMYKKSGYGWGDYWVYLKNKDVEINIEVKHTHHTIYPHKPITDWIKKEWGAVNRQIDDLQNDTVISKKKPITIALLFVQTYKNSKSKKFKELNEPDITSHFDNMTSELNPKPSFRDVLKYPPKISKKSFDYCVKAEKQYEQYYSLEVFAYIQ